MGKRTWTEAEDAVMHARYPHESADAIAISLGKSKASIYSRARTLGISKTDAFWDSPVSGRTDGLRGKQSRFQKGQQPWNKGIKGLHIGGEETQFKKGSTPHNHVPVGTEVIATIGYLKVKVAEPNVWEWVHRRNWTEANGEIPKGMTLIFKDGNKLNCAIENLELINRADLMRRNTIHRHPKPLRLAMRTHGRLRRLLESEDEKQN